MFVLPQLSNHPTSDDSVLFLIQWLKKMASAGFKTDNANSDAVDMEEMNPVWLKDKGM